VKSTLPTSGKKGPEGESRTFPSTRERRAQQQQTEEKGSFEVTGTVKKEKRLENMRIHFTKRHPSRASRGVDQRKGSRERTASSREKELCRRGKASLRRTAPRDDLRSREKGAFREGREPLHPFPPIKTKRRERIKEYRV